MLPYADYCPARTYQFSVDNSISPLISSKFLPPELAVRLGKLSVDWAAVPETAVDEDCDASFREDEIGGAKHTVPAAPSSNPMFSED